jgi:hypothetical protein
MKGSGEGYKYVKIKHKKQQIDLSSRNRNIHKKFHLFPSAHAQTLKFRLLQFGEHTIPPTKHSSTVTTNRMYINCNFTAAQKQLLKPRESTSFLTNKVHDSKVLFEEGKSSTQQFALDRNLKNNESNCFIL